MTAEATPSTASYRSLDQKPYESIYLHAETIIDHPVERVWPHALDIGRWMNAHRLKSLAGAPGRVGHFERVYPRDLGEDVAPPHYHLYGIAEIIPFKLIALEVLPEKGGSYGNAREWMSFDSVLFADLGGRTQVIFLMVDAHLGKGDEEYYTRRKAEIEQSRGKLERYFDNLRQQVEAAV
jgi:hypothetical protein